MSGYTELNIDLTEEQSAIKEETHRFAKEVLRPASLELDKMDPAAVIKSDLYWNTMKKGYDLGYHTIFIPDTYGGLATDPLETHIVLEELSWGSVEFAIGLGVSCFPAFFASMVPDDHLIEKIIEPFCACKDASIIGCWGITEPEHGTDTLCPYTPQFTDPKITGQVTATLDGDEWVINGQKAAWVSNGTVATQALVYLTIDPSMGMSGGGICIVPLDLPGVRKGKPLDKMGQRALNQGEIYFDGVRVPKGYMLVDEESYDAMLDLTLSTANAGMGAMFVGVARAAYEEALTYSKQRIQGGKPIFEHQLIKHKLFNIFMKIEAARALSRSAMIYNYNNTPPKIEYSIASKVFCTNIALEATSEAIQIFGGNGLSREYPVEKFYRDARAGLIEDGANDSLMLTGAHHL
ncbi:MAG: acyl-CoA/acyl-ACP dehydrogenase [Deltaproteobacteria bacterium]|nr:acyl-CoA/acyl-ACP dehydrogenase [Deltaproteobacteria bacterium]MBW1847311.1 acyl-CoA/acyl-ACP dehydrogenase [Deltaproteobacteria bacterium]MBW1983560.1 acyl-CoA/acyl-ACP dehydrogenase [Deltaproteobacteria bacterium]MBW2363744.1 acyl-CoA/acyl-ACP dehydrogenase [Deltaproteobacteria bacterium]